MTGISPPSFMAINSKVVEALRVLGQVLGEERRRFVLIGAMVPQILIDLRQERESIGRTTEDADAVVRVTSWDDFNRMRRQLFQVGFQPGSAPHTLRFGEDVQIDLIPFGPEIAQGDHLVWPETGNVMNTLGMEEAFRCARAEELVPGFSLPLVSIAGLVLLKTVAYQDRPEERARDLTDVMYCFEHYEEALEGSRRFDLAGVAVEGQTVQFEEAGAYLLGTEVAKLAKPKSLMVVRKFLDDIPDEYARPIDQILREERRVADTAEVRRKELFRFFQVFVGGLSRGAAAS